MKTWVFSLSYPDFLGCCWVRPWGGPAAMITLTWAEGFPIHGTVILSEIRSCPLRCWDEETETQRGQSPYEAWETQGFNQRV